jgi:hypothetical protein
VKTDAKVEPTPSPLVWRPTMNEREDWSSDQRPKMGRSASGMVLDAVERFFIGLAIVSVAGLLVTRGAHGNVGGDQQLRQGTQEILSLQ